MDTVHKDIKEANGYRNKPFVPVDSEETEDQTDGEEYKAEDQNDEEKESESQSLLAVRKPEKTRRKVKWNDNNGNELTEVLIYEPSDASDSDDEGEDSCICTIM